MGDNPSLVKDSNIKQTMKPSIHATNTQNIGAGAVTKKAPKYGLSKNPFST